MIKALLVVALAALLPLCIYAQGDKIRVRCKPCTLDEFFSVLEGQTHKVILVVADNAWRMSDVWLSIKSESLDSVLAKAFKKGTYKKQTRPTGEIVVALVPKNTRQSTLLKPATVLDDSIRTLPTFIRTFSNGVQTLPVRDIPVAVSVVGQAELRQSADGDVLTRALRFISGVQSGTQTANPHSIWIWGPPTLQGNSAPNFIVNGFSWQGRLGDINAEDVDNISVLKNSSTGAIYDGISGGGVIDLKLKKGSYNHRLSVDLLSNTTITQRPNTLYQPRLSSSAFIDAEHRGFDSGYYDNYFADPTFPLSEAVRIYRMLWEKKISDQDANERLDLLRQNDLQKDIQKDLFRSAFSRQYHIGIEQGLANYHSYTGLSWMNDPTSMVRNGIRQYSAYSSHTFRTPDHRFETCLSLNYTSVEQLLNNTGTVGVTTPYLRLADDRGRPLAVTWQLSDQYINNPGSPYLDYHYRPLDELQLADNRYAHHNFYGQLGFTIRIARDLYVETMGRASWDFSQQHNYYGPGTYTFRDSVNRAIMSGEQGYTPPKDFSRWSDTTATTYAARTLVRYANPEGATFHWRGLAGGEISDHHVSALSELYDRDVLVFANLSLIYRGRYALFGSSRTLGANFAGVAALQHWASFGSIGYRQQLLRVDTIKGQYPDQLSVRASYGSDGNPGTRTANLSTTILADGAYRNPQAGIDHFVNPRRTWERRNILNIGLDFNFIRDLHNQQGFIWGSIDWYYKWAVHLLGYDSLPPSAGINGIGDFYSNKAMIKGRGIDLDLNSINIKQKGFIWTSRLLLSMITDRVSAYRNQPASPVAYVENRLPMVGKSPSGLFSYKYAELSADSGNPQGYLGKDISTNYNALRNSSDGGLVYHGSYQPEIFGRLQNTFLLGSFSISMGLAFDLKFFLRRPSIDYDGMAMGRSAGDPDLEHGWAKPGDEKSTLIPSMPRVLNMERGLFFLNSTATVIRGDNLRLDNLRFCFNAPSMGKKHWKELQFYLNIENVCPIWRNTRFHIDPTATYNIYHAPAPRVFSFGTRITY